jgi:hypothetical protein
MLWNGCNVADPDMPAGTTPSASGGSSNMKLEPTAKRMVEKRRGSLLPSHVACLLQSAAFDYTDHIAHNRKLFDFGSGTARIKDAKRMSRPRGIHNATMSDRSPRLLRLQTSNSTAAAHR